MSQELCRHPGLQRRGRRCSRQRFPCRSRRTLPWSSRIPRRRLQEAHAGAGSRQYLWASGENSQHRSRFTGKTYWPVGGPILEQLVSEGVMSFDINFHLDWGVRSCLKIPILQKKTGLKGPSRKQKVHCFLFLILFFFSVLFFNP